MAQHTANSTDAKPCAAASAPRQSSALKNLVDCAEVGEREKVAEFSLGFQSDCDAYQHVEADVCTCFESLQGWKRHAGRLGDVNLRTTGG